MTALLCIGLAVSVASLLAQNADDRVLAEYVRTHETTDPILAKTSGHVRAVLGAATREAKAPSVDLHVTEFGSDDRFGAYRGRKCVPEMKAFGKPTIVCDAAFFREIELMIRTFDAAARILMIEHNVLEIAKQIKKDVMTPLRGWRSESHPAQAPDHVAQHLTMVMLFVSGHELGHIANGDADGGFMNFTPSRLDKSAERAVLKMCRHADEFARHKFGLPGWEELVTAGSEPRKSIEQIRARYAEEDEILTRRFDSERKADDFANALLLRHLESVAKPGSREADFIAAQSLFAFALFQWHKTFLDLEQMCEVPVTSKSLGFCFMQSLDRYRAAEAVFGAEHRVMYLRAVFALQLIVDKRLRLMPRSEPETPLEASLDRSQADKQRAIAEMYALLGMLMDTPVKLAYAGCASGTDRAATDGGPTLLMSFEPIEVAMKRLERLLEKR